MKKMIVFLIAMLLVSPAAFAGKDKDHCQKIKGKAVLQDVQENCEFAGINYSACYTAKVKGTLKGSWSSYVHYDWYIVLEDLGVQTPDLAGESWYNREFEVFHAKHGSVWGNAQFILDDQFVTSDGGASIPTMVTGGTGIYEDATGWINAIYIGVAMEYFSINGLVCGPNIK